MKWTALNSLPAPSPFLTCQLHLAIHPYLETGKPLDRGSVAAIKHLFYKHSFLSTRSLDAASVFLMPASLLSMRSLLASLQFASETRKLPSSRILSRIRPFGVRKHGLCIDHFHRRITILI